MPTYEYLCDRCDESIEIFQRMSEDPLKVCPKDKCRLGSWGKGKIRRSISGGAGLIFKGSGFYITDYRSDSYKEAAKKDSESTKKTEGKNESSPKKAESAPTSAPASQAGTQ